MYAEYNKRNMALRPVAFKEKSYGLNGNKNKKRNNEKISKTWDLNDIFCMKHR